MRLNGVFALAVALALGGCETMELRPVQTGSVRSRIGSGASTMGTTEFEAALPNAILTCLKRGAQVKTPEFERCVSDVRRVPSPTTSRPWDRMRVEADNSR